MSRRYAADTSVSVEKSRAEIETILRRYGAEAFSYGWNFQQSVIQFKAHGRMLKFVLPLPDRKERRFTHTSGKGLERSPYDAERAWEQSCRQSWRALALVIKAKLEAVECGIVEFEQEFLAHIVLPNGDTVGNWIIPQIEESYQTKSMPKLLAWEGN
jgi:hypothetical protein